MATALNASPCSTITPTTTPSTTPTTPSSSSCEHISNEEEAGIGNQQPSWDHRADCEREADGWLRQTQEAKSDEPSSDQAASNAHWLVSSSSDPSWDDEDDGSEDPAKPKPMSRVAYLKKVLKSHAIVFGPDTQSGKLGLPICSWTLSEEKPQEGALDPNVPTLTVTTDEGTTKFLEDQKAYLEFHEIRECLAYY